MKIALINDTHFGARGDSQLFFDYFMKFFDEVFFPYIEENDIKTVIHAGDLMDRRKFVNFNILNQIRTRFIDRIKEMGIDFHCILGNHDVYYRNTNTINSIKELFGNDLILHENPTVINVGELDIALLPWINKENESDSIEFIKTAAAPLLIGHLELKGYDVMRGVKYDGGMESSIFSRYEQVLTGHFHCRQEHGNIYYLGTQYQITFSDLNETKGFHVLDTETRELEFIKNPYKMFHTLAYNDEAGPIDVDEMKVPVHFKDSYIKLYVEKKKHPYTFDRFMDKLYESGVAKITIVEELSDSEWTKEEKIDIYKDNAEGMKYQKVVFNSMGGMNECKREKNKSNVIKKLSERTDFKE